MSHIQKEFSPVISVISVTYLPFRDVISICQVNKKLHKYCTDPKYSIQWKILVQNTFSQVHNYEDKLGKIQSNLNLGKDDYNYIVYTQFVKTLDPITQLMIYYRQKDIKSFDEDKFNNTQRFLALFLLGKKEEIKNYYPVLNTKDIC